MEFRHVLVLATFSWRAGMYFWSHVATVDSEGVRVADVAGSVRRHARVHARVPRSHGFDAEGAHMLINPRDRDIRIVRINRIAVKFPSDLYGKVALRNGTRRRDHVTPIRRSVIDRERPYVRRNYNITIMCQSTETNSLQNVVLQTCNLTI